MFSQPMKHEEFINLLTTAEELRMTGKGYEWSG
jgi:hypothetical protein